MLALRCKALQLVAFQISKIGALLICNELQDLLKLGRILCDAKCENRYSVVCRVHVLRC